MRVQQCLNSNFIIIYLFICFQIAGYSTELKPEALASYEYPNGNKWKELFASGKYKDPKKENN